MTYVRTCMVRQHQRRLPPRKIDNSTHRALRAYVEELRFVKAFTQAFEAEMRKPWLVPLRRSALTQGE